MRASSAWPSARRASARWALALAAVALTAPAALRAEVPPAIDPRGREFRVDFSAKHLEVDAELGELSLSGDVRVTVGRYRLGGERVRLKRGPRGIDVEGSGEIAFCRCDAAPVRLGYRSVTLAPPSDVIIQGAVLRAGPVPLLWLPYLWLRSPDRLAIALPSAEWRGEDGLLLGSGVHVPFDSNQGRPPARALDLGLFAYTEGGARVDARLLTPRSSTLVRWDYLDAAALTLDAHGASAGEAGELVAFELDASRGARGRRALTDLGEAAQRYDRARLGVASSSAAGLLALGAAADSERGLPLDEPGALGPFALLATGGALGTSSSYALELGAGARTTPSRSRDAEQRALERASVRSSARAGPLLATLSGFQQAELLATPAQALAGLRFGAGAELALPLVRRFGSLLHGISPRLLARLERRHEGGADGESELVALAGLESALGGARRSAAGSVALDAGAAGSTDSPSPVVKARAAVDARLLGLRLAMLAEPEARAGDGLARLRLGARGGTHLVTYVEGATAEAPGRAALAARGALSPAWLERSAFDREGWSGGAELHLFLWSELSLWAGGDLDLSPAEAEPEGGILGSRAGVGYRHRCGCFAASALASRRVGRGGFDAALSLDLMP